MDLYTHTLADEDRKTLGEQLLGSPALVSKCRLTLSTTLKVLAHAMTGVASTAASDGKEKMGLLAGHVQLDGERKTVVVTEVRTVLARWLRDRRSCLYFPLSHLLSFFLSLSLSSLLSLTHTPLP